MWYGVGTRSVYLIKSNIVLLSEILVIKHLKKNQIKNFSFSFFFVFSIFVRDTVCVCVSLCVYRLLFKS